MNKKQAVIVTGGIIVAIAAVFFVAGFIQEQELQRYDCRPTPSNPEGPYYMEDAPFKEKFGADLQGERFHLSGRVLDQNCKPVEGAVIDLWHTDSYGDYDNSGYVLRGKIRTDSDGRYFLDTVFPEKYSEAGVVRPRHIHLKVWAPDEPPLTTQLYFENDLDRDIFVKDSLVLSVERKDGIKTSTYDFVIKTY